MVFIPTIIDPKKIDEWKEKQPRIGKCNDCEATANIERFQIDKKLKCPKCGVELTRVHFTQGIGMGVIMTDDDAMGQFIKTSRHNPNNEFDQEKYDEAIDKLNKTDYDEIVTGVKK